MPGTASVNPMGVQESPCQWKWPDPWTNTTLGHSRGRCAMKSMTPAQQSRWSPKELTLAPSETIVSPRKLISWVNFAIKGERVTVKGHKFHQVSAVESSTLDIEANEGARRISGVTFWLVKGRGLWRMVLGLAVVLSNKSAGKLYKGVQEGLWG